MSDRRHSTRATLPEGYQFGDAGQRRYRFDACYGFAVPDFTPRCVPVIMCGCDDWLTCVHPWPQLVPALTRRDVLLGYGPLDRGWRAPHENAAAQLNRRQREDAI